MSTVPIPGGSVARGSVARTPVHASIPDAAPPAAVVEPIDLAGPWRCVLDRDDALDPTTAFVTTASALTVPLPGTLNQAGVGDPLTLEPSLDRTVMRGLHLRTRYVGVAWFQRSIDVPADLADRPLDLSLERVLWTSRLWIDGQPLGQRDSLSTPHLYHLPRGLDAGRHTLTLRIDNRPLVNLGGSHAYSDETQGIWHGVVGAMTLQRRGVVCVTRARARPDLATRSLRLEIDLTASGPLQADGTLDVTARLRGRHEPAATLSLPFSLTRCATLRGVLALGEDAGTWDEFHPDLYDVTLLVRTRSPLEDADTRTIAVGLRELVARPGELLLNGRPHFLRGTLECCIFPRTAHPPCDVAEWRRIFAVARSYGLNHLRFHSWCPPEAAFAAADESGLILQVELPNWSFHDTTPGSDLLFYLREEGKRLLDAYGNHPSLALVAMGNELPGDFATWDALLRDLRDHDDRPLYASTSFSFSDRGRWPGPDDAFYVTQQTKLGWTRGQGVFNSTPPATDADFAAAVAGCPVPVVSHEVGQYSVFPDLRQIEHYTGPLRPLNLEAVRDHLASRGLLERAADFTRASGRLAVELYREDIERALRTPGLSGIQLLDLHDFPGQSTALVGILDAFWNGKGLVDPATFRQWCGPVTLLLRLGKRVFVNGERLAATLEIANFGREPMEHATIDWTLVCDDGTEAARGASRVPRVPLGRSGPVGVIDVPLGGIARATRVQLRARLRGSDVANAWNVWVYPDDDPRDADEAGDVLIAQQLDDGVRAALQAGRRVLLLPHSSTLKHRLRGQFVPVFWSPLHFPQQPGTQGILADPTHPALADFPTAEHADWQWWELTSTASAMVLDDLPGAPRPIVQFVDHLARNATPALVWEAKVRAGRLLVCTLDVGSDLESRPAARQLRRSLLAYARGEHFAPLATVEPAALDEQFKPPSPLARARVVSASSFQPGCEPALALEEDPQTLWHNDWSGGHRHPHELTIDLGETRLLEGFTLLPRQDASGNGFVDAFELHVSTDGVAWELAVEGRLPRDPARKAVPFPARYDASGRLLAPARAARFVRLVIRSGHEGTHDVAIAQLEFLPVHGR